MLRQRLMKSMCDAEPGWSAAQAAEGRLHAANSRAAVSIESGTFMRHLQVMQPYSQEH